MSKRQFWEDEFDEEFTENPIYHKYDYTTHDGRVLQNQSLRMELTGKKGMKTIYDVKLFIKNLLDKVNKNQTLLNN